MKSLMHFLEILVVFFHCPAEHQDVIHVADSSITSLKKFLHSFLEDLRSNGDSEWQTLHPVPPKWSDERGELSAFRRQRKLPESCCCI